MAMHAKGTAVTSERERRAATILVVEDDDDLREAMAAFLETEGYAIAQAANGADALAYLRNTGRPRLILLDLSMPVMDGWQFHREVHGDAKLAAIPVVVVSGRRDGERPIPQPASGFVPKPLDPTALLAAVRRFCS